MNAKRPRAHVILEHALTLEGAERDAYITEACGDDGELATEVRSLLSQESRPDDPLEHGPSADATILDTPGSASQPLTASHPRRISNYTIRRIIGAGGMGTVYEATQDHPRRRVAIKVLKTGVTSKSALRRFEYESQVLGRLRHHGIAQIYEAGTWDGGEGSVPWFAMEYIPNAKFLNQYAEVHHLSVHERLALFVKVCHAVHHGHQKGIIHRDLKPGNILVDPTGQPKVIDFGVARSTDSDIAVTTMQTTVGQLIGTVQYMSPEQCDADPDDLDIRSDVYTLGVILYELLTGSMPYQFGNKALHEAARAIKEDAPGNPSTINRQLRGDAETVVLTALEKERERRYQSAQALADDIERFLRGDPITARPPSMLYQLRIIARKNKAAAVLSMAVLAILLVAIVLVSFFAVSQGHQKDLADTARLAADQRATEAATARAEADANAEEARVASEQAEMQAEEARQATAMAVQRAQEAEEARLQAETATAALQEANTSLERNVYIAALVRAQSALENKYHGKAVQVLAEAPPKYRNWEWSMLNSQADQSLSKTIVETGPWRYLSPDSTYFYNRNSWSVNLLKINAAEEDERFLHPFVDPSGNVIGKEILEFKKDHDIWWGVRFSEDSRYLVTFWMAWEKNGPLLTRGGLRVWDLDQDGVEPIIDRSTPTPSACFQPGTNHLAWTRIEDLDPENMPNEMPLFTTNPNTIVLEDITNPGKSIKEIPALPGVSKVLRFSPDGRFIGSRRDFLGFAIYDRNSDSFSELYLPEGDTGDTPTGWFGFSGDSRYFWTGRRSNNIISLWETESKEHLQNWNTPDDFGRPISSPSGEYMVYSDPMGTLHVRSIPEGELISTLNGHIGSVKDLEINNAGQLVSNGSDDTIRTWGRNTTQQPNPRIFETGGKIQSIDLRKDGRLAVVVVDDSMQIWDMELNRKIVQMPLEEAPSDIEISPDGRYVAMSMSNSDRLVDMWDLQTGLPLSDVIEGASQLERARSNLGIPLRFDADGSRLAWASGNTASIIPLGAEGKPAVSLEPVKDARFFHELRFSEDGSSLLAMSWPSRITEWDLSTGISTEVLPSTNRYGAQTFSTTARMRAIGLNTGTIILTPFDAPDDEINIPGTGIAVDALDFSQDGSRLAVVGKNGTLIIINTSTGDEVLFLSGNSLSKSIVNLQLDLGEAWKDMTGGKNQLQFGVDNQTLVMGFGSELFTWTSMPVSERRERQGSAERRLLMARAIADGLLTGNADLEQVVDSVRTDPAIDENLRHEALMEILLRSSAWPLVEEGRLDEAKDRQMAIYKQLRAKYGLQNRRTQHALAGLIRIYEDMGNKQSAFLLKRKLAEAREDD